MPFVKTSVTESVIIIALITSRRERGHSSGDLFDSFMTNSSCGNSSSMPKNFASSYTPVNFKTKEECKKATYKWEAWPEGDFSAPTRHNERYLAISDAGKFFRTSIDIGQEIDSIYDRVREVAQNWYGKKYLMPLPYDPDNGS